MSDLHPRFTQAWGFVTYGSDGFLSLSAPRDAPDGIGSALAVSDEALLREGPVKITWELAERWGGAEDWRGFWLMFPPRAGWADTLPYPMAYYRPTLTGFEIGEVVNGTPAGQHIWATWTSDVRRLREEVLVSQDAAAVHAWRSQGGTISLPIGPRLLGLYCEGSTVRVRVERG